MTYRSARRSGAVAGALLLAMPTMEVLFGFADPGPMHFIVGTLGLSLVVLSGRLR